MNAKLSGNARENLKHRIMEQVESLLNKLAHAKVVRNAAEMRKAELAIVAVTDTLAGELIKAVMERSLQDQEFVDEGRSLIKQAPARMKNHGQRAVEIQPYRGAAFTVATTYYCKAGLSPQRAEKKKGLHYPELTLLGVVAHHTPVAASEIAQTATALSSLTEAVAILAARGRAIDVKTLRNLTYQFAAQARFAQQSLQFTLTDTVAGKRCAVSVDGGRIRIRTTKRGRKTSKKRNRFNADWREPKLLHIWLLNAEGKICREFSPWIDGTLNGPDEVFMLLAHYLRALNITAADQVIFIADGAPWIWNRIPALINNLKLDPAKVHLIVDFYHAVGHLNVIAQLCKRWPEKRRRQWVSRLRGYLLTGKISEVVAAVHDISRGRNGKLIARERHYFENNIDKMQYATATKNHLPIGSGPMESAIRRVINLRMKGNGIFWLEENAEAMIMLRSYYKAGRWNDLFLLAIAVTGNSQ